MRKQGDVPFAPFFYLFDGICHSLEFVAKAWPYKKINIFIDKVRNASTTIKTISSKLNQLEYQLFSLNYAVDSRIKARKGIGSSILLALFPAAVLGISMICVKEGGTTE
ncbi:hypothetical protein DYI25_14830 [Mesobacillus boroniphilus]|uniref:Uncharacterized protein n=1 Tax=Mesobacillus boroniphilus TaxID=308892 RepID=A0A944CMF5_9BACI|nr:hypothetical protein [Mesobacillus boroniphilus]